MVLDSHTGNDAWGQIRYEDVEAVADEDGSVLVVPIGSYEQHGHHLPTATDTILVSEIARLGVERVTDQIPILRTPPIWTGYSPHHLGFGGTITLGLETMLLIVKDVAKSALKNGFDALVLVNGHGGNMSIISDLVSEIGVEHPGVEVHGITYFSLAESFIDEVRDSDLGGMGHAGEFETSLMLYLHPNLVRGDAIEGTHREREFSHSSSDMFEGGKLVSYRNFDAHSESGAIGDPALASADKGERIYERLGDEMETLLAEIHKSAKR